MKCYNCFLISPCAFKTCGKSNVPVCGFVSGLGKHAGGSCTLSILHNNSACVSPKWLEMLFIVILINPIVVETCTAHMSRDMKKKIKGVRPAKTQISLGIRPVWSESSLSAWRNLGSLSTHWAHSEDAEPRLIWVFTGRTLILLVLLCRGSNMRLVGFYSVDILLQVFIRWSGIVSSAFLFKYFVRCGKITIKDVMLCAIIKIEPPHD